MNFNDAFFSAVLNKEELLDLHNKGSLVEGELDANQFQSNSVDLTLLGKFKTIEYNSWIFHHASIDTRIPIKYVEHEFHPIDEALAIGYSNESNLIPSKDRWLRVESNEFLVLETKEVLNLPDGICGMITGRKTLTETGLHITGAGFIDNGFHGRPTIQVFNHSQYPIYLFENMKICQIMFYHTVPSFVKLSNTHQLKIVPV